MRKRIIDWIFTLQSQRGILGEKERRLYTYAYGLLLNKIAIYAIIAIVGTITGNWIGMFSFLLPFTILRQYAGGIHLEKPMNCIIFSGFLVFGCGQYLAVASDIYDVIERFSLNRETVILGLSNLAFDLSVFDIFGCFQVGGTLVLPDDELKKNPKHILDLIIINRVTVLNAVPAQMKMLDSYMDNAGILEISWVKLIIMSGDWIPVGLPENLFKKFTRHNFGSKCFT